ncbi:PAS domain S-box protein [Methylobacterium sp. NEAU 140]|uniref:PAS domain S-box protein n=1 Tax=Methylobacterium sp. NEAU 140 TaxID=3064945 RepID=UPI0027323AE8|nr:PAS domain S-box protein [Methylobacterium sp. NEAU 140]MDP4026754.1 PAS domain S-box protein [Methylobacterium sp. NEAU 140]
MLFSAVEKTGLPMIVTDPNRPNDPIVFANRAFLELTGYAADEVMGRNCRFLQGPDTEPNRLAELRAALAEDRDIALEITNHRRDGTPFVNHLFVGPVYGADGRLLYRFGSQLDVTEVHRNRARLVESEERQRAILDSAIEMAIIATDTEGRITDWNVGAERILGWSAEEMRGRTVERIFTPEDRAAGRAEAEMRRALADGSAEDERWHLRKDGRRFYAAGDMTPLRGVGGEHRGFVKAMSDRTPQREAAAKQQADAEFMRGVLASSADCIKVLDLDGDLTFMSEGGMRVMEVSDFNHIRGCPWLNFWQGQGHADAVVALDAAKAGGVGHFQGAADTYLGTPKWWDVQVTPILGADERPEKILSVSRDITEQKSVEGRLAASEERWRGLFTGMQEGFLSAELVRDADGRAVDFRFLEVNPAFAGLTGLPADSAGRTMRDLVPDIPQWLIDTYARVIETGAPENFEIHVPELHRTFEVRASRQDERRFAALFLEISDRKRTEARRAATAELGDRLRDVDDRREITRIAAEIMGRTLGLSHAGYGQVDLSAETILVEQEWTAPGLTDIAGLHRFRDYGSYIEDLKAGRNVVIGDTAGDPRTAEDADALAAISARGLLNLPVLEHGRLVALFYGLRAEPGAWAPEDIAFVRNVVDRTRSAVARVEAEARRDLLNHELSHRMKNLLAMVQSIAAQTMRAASAVEEARDVLGGRLIALGKAHDLLMGGALAGTRIRDVVREALAVHGAGGDRIQVSGPDEGIGADQALSLSLMLHELATNAAKYGALSNGDGRVEVDWERLADGGEPLLRLRWRERGGPLVAPPTRKGFGSRFIQRALATQVGGELSLDYPPEGVVCTLTAPLAAFGATRETTAAPRG